jgi:hypothetical protein
MNKYQIKRTSVSGRTPNTTNSSNTAFIDAGELAINLPDGKLFSSDGSALFEIGANLATLSVSGNTVVTNILINGNLTVNGTSTTLSSLNLSLSDNMIYLNEAITEDIQNATGNGSVVVYRLQKQNGQITPGMVVRVTGVTPTSFNTSGYVDVIASNSTTFSITSTVTDSYTNGGTAYGKAAVNPDLGLAGGYNDGTYHHAGFFRDATDGIWKVFDNYEPEPDGPYIDTSNSTFHIANFQANVIYGVDGTFTGNVSALKTTANIATFGSNTFFANSTVIKINADDVLTFNDGTTQNTAFRVYDSAGTRIA